MKSRLAVLLGLAALATAALFIRRLTDEVPSAKDSPNRVPYEHGF
jgi:hypothetical protein